MTRDNTLRADHRVTVSLLGGAITMALSSSAFAAVTVRRQDARLPRTHAYDRRVTRRTRRHPRPMTWGRVRPERVFDLPVGVRPR